MRSEHVSGQTGNGACGDLVCETGALRLWVVVSWCTSSLARIVAIFKLPLGLCEPDPRSLCLHLARSAAAPKLLVFALSES
jgi:hypothetical protein